MENKGKKKLKHQIYVLKNPLKAQKILIEEKHQLSGLSEVTDNNINDAKMYWTDPHMKKWKYLRIFYLKSNYNWVQRPSGF